MYAVIHSVRGVIKYNIILEDAQYIAGNQDSPCAIVPMKYLVG